MNKEFVTGEFRDFSERLILQMEKNEENMKDTNIMYWKDSHYRTITQDDKLFFKVIDDNLDSLTRKNPSISNDLDCLKLLLSEGGLFYRYRKNSETGKYERAYVIVKDNRDMFYLGQDKKFFVFDATADIDPHYMLDYVDVKGDKKYFSRLNMKITNVNVPIGKYAWENKPEKADVEIGFIKKFLKEQLKKDESSQEDILIATYKSACNQFDQDFRFVGYFGNLKGLNEYRELYKMAHIGMNRFPTQAYYYIYCGCNRDKYVSLSDKKNSADYLKDIYTNKIPPQFLIKTIANALLADFEQNIFRLAIRNPECTTSVHIWTFYKSDTEPFVTLSKLIEKRYKPYGAEFEYIDTPVELHSNKINMRKTSDGKKSHAQIINEWVCNLPLGSHFQIKDIIVGTGLTNKQIQKARENNKSIAGMFENYKTNKKGHYIRKN